MRATIYIWIRFEQAITFVVIAAIHILDKVVCKLLLQQHGSKTIAFVSSLYPLNVSFLSLRSLSPLYIYCHLCIIITVAIVAIYCNATLFMVEAGYP